jgi:tight adherence protein B
MTGLALTLALAGGVALLLFGAQRQPSGRSPTSRLRVDHQLRTLLSDAGVEQPPAALAAACALTGVLACVIAAVIAPLPVLVLATALAGAWAPIAWLRARRASRLRERERAWPDALRQIADALEAGLAFPAAVQLAADAGPVLLRRDWRVFAARSRAGGLKVAIDGLTDRGERAAETVALLLRAGLLELPAGGLAPALRELAGVLGERFEARERARSRAASLHTEAAVLALSPIVLLLIIGLSSPIYLDAYRTPGGTLVVLVAAVLIFGCWLAMRQLGRIPEPRRTEARR